jgi:hypothetical protein
MLVVTLCASSNAEARRRGYYYRYFDQNAVGDRNQAGGLTASGAGSLPSRGAGFVPTVDQLIRGCGQEAVELKNWPFDYLAQIVGPDEGQRNAANASDILASTCPREIPAALTARFDALKQGLGAFMTALDAVRPAIETFYTALNDEQKARLVAVYISNNGVRESSDQPRRASRNSYRQVSSTQHEIICEKWAGALRDWPTRQIEANMTLSDIQHAALYDLTAMTYRAAGALTASCPTETSFTPLGQIEAKRKRVDALAQAISMIRPVLDRFADTLNDEQKIRLVKILSSTQMTVPAVPTAPRRRSDDAD